MHQFSRIQHSIIILLLISFSTPSLTRDKSIKPSKVINKYGFNSWNLDKCNRVVKSHAKKLSLCIRQHHKHHSVGRYTQYKCKSKEGEILIYRTAKICNQLLNSMHLEAN